MEIDKLALNSKDLMYKFLEEPTRENFSTLVINNTGEQNNIDFKSEWIKPQKIVQIILGMSNTGGGAIVFGIKENKDGTNVAIGLEIMEDKAKVQGQIENYLPKELCFEIYDFDYSSEEYSKFKDKKFQVLLVSSYKKNLPYICAKSGDDIKEGAVYVRRGTKTEVANTLEMQTLISKRVDSLYSNTSEIELQEHLTQLQVLYSNIDRNLAYYTGGIGEILSEKVMGLAGILGKTTYKNNPQYPREDFDQFIVRMIEQKKIKIEKVLDLK